MIELPRANYRGRSCKRSRLFSFGTNDLTQTTFGLSRDDSGKFLPAYVEMGILENDPFVSLDYSGVGFLVNHASIEEEKIIKNTYRNLWRTWGGSKVY